MHMPPPGGERGGGADRDTGLATVWAAGAVAALLVVAGIVWTLGVVVVTRHRLAGVADLAALAAAGRAEAGVEVACARAEELAEGMAARLTDCALDGWDARVVVVAPVRGVAGLGGTVTARSRAGPVLPHP